MWKWKRITMDFVVELPHSSDEVGEKELTGPKIIQDADEKVALIKRRLGTAASR